jgi:hypothetical protein
MELLSLDEFPGSERASTSSREEKSLEELPSLDEFPGSERASRSSRGSERASRSSRLQRRPGRRANMEVPRRSIPFSRAVVEERARRRRNAGNLREVPGMDVGTRGQFPDGARVKRHSIPFSLTVVEASERGDSSGCRAGAGVTVPGVSSDARSTGSRSRA